MRADRLITLLLLLQTRPKVTAAEVADELEISERTARRDLEALAMSGVPIYSTPGRGGGWQLLGGAKTDLSGLSSHEARALFLAAGSNLDRAPELKSALAKLSGALPETFRAEADAAATAIKIDPTGWGRVGDNYTPPHLEALTTAVVTGRQVDLEYESPRSGPSLRRVSPLGLVTKRNVWYLVANTPKGIRTFRVARVQSATPLDSPVNRPAGFDLEAEWERIITEIENIRTTVEVEVIAEQSVVKALRYQFQGRVELGAELRNGRQRLIVRENDVRPLAAQLASHGGAVEVIDPSPELRREFERIASELADCWLSPERREGLSG